MNIQPNAFDAMLDMGGAPLRWGLATTLGRELNCVKKEFVNCTAILLLAGTAATFVPSSVALIINIAGVAFAAMTGSYTGRSAAIENVKATFSSSGFCSDTAITATYLTLFSAVICSPFSIVFPEIPLLSCSLSGIASFAASYYVALTIAEISLKGRPLVLQTG